MLLITYQLYYTCYITCLHSKYNAHTSKHITQIFTDTWWHISHFPNYPQHFEIIILLNFNVNLF